MPESSVAVAPSCRSVTAEEIAHYQEFGWVKLKGFVEPETVRFLLETARQRMGEDGDSTEGISQPYFTVGYSGRSEEHTSELQSLMRISYAVFCLTKQNKSQTCTQNQHTHATYIKR